MMNLNISYDGKKWWHWSVDNDMAFTRWYEVLASGKEKTQEEAEQKAKDWADARRALKAQQKSYSIKVAE